MPEKKEDGDFSRRLLDWYKVQQRRLPWRGSRDPYGIWVSEVMLQQTGVRTVIPYYKKWLAQFPDIRSLARAPLRRVLKAWEGLGYYQRAGNLHRAARIIDRRFSGKIPRDYDVLHSLPGFGPYTTAAVLSLAYGLPYPVLDANVRRVLLRFHAIRTRPAGGLERALWPRLLRIFPAQKPGRFNQAMMELGALLCRPRAPRCPACPVRRDCRAAEKGWQNSIPAPLRRRPQKIETVVGLIERDGKYLIQKRPPAGLLAGLWEFPGGKREDGESLVAALRRELKEELGVRIRRPQLVLTVKHAYTRFQVTLYAFACGLASPLATAPGRRLWVALRDLKGYPFPSASLKIIRFLEDREA